MRVRRLCFKICELGMVIAMVQFAFPFECCFSLRRWIMVYEMSQDIVTRHSQQNHLSEHSIINYRIMQ